MTYQSRYDALAHALNGVEEYIHENSIPGN